MTTADVQALIRSDLAKREEQARRNRAAFPYAAELMDLFAEFNPKLIYAEEDGRTIGRQPDSSQSLDGDRLVAMIDATTRTVNAMNKRKRT